MQDRPDETRGTAAWTEDRGATTDEAKAEDRSRFGETAEKETWSPGGGDVSSSASPVGEGSNTPVGDEPSTFRSWESQQDMGGQTWGDSRLLGESKWALGAGAAGAIGLVGLLFAWWKRRQTRQTRMERVRHALLAAAADAGEHLPRAIGKAAGKADSPLLPLALLPIALLLRSQGGRAEKASEELLKPLKLEDRSRRLARDTAKLVETEGRRWIRENDPNRSRGLGWTPWLVGIPALAGGAYYAYRWWMGSGEDYSTV
jgi:hypothetical protein